jgi:oxidase EvaA
MINKKHIAETESNLNGFLKQIVDNSDFSLKKIKFSEQDQWSFANGSLAHHSNGFFGVVGVKNRYSNKEHLALYQPQSGITGLILHKDRNKVYILLQGKIEPGNSNVGQYGPTVQCTPANYLMRHGGKRTAYIDLFLAYNHQAHLLAYNSQLDLGQRYFQKTKTHNYIEVDHLLETEENMIWVSLDAIARVINKDNYLNADLRSMLSIFDWDLFVDPDLASKRNKETAYSSDYLTGNLLGINEWKLVPIKTLKGWQVTESGIQDKSDSGIWIDMFDVQRRAREVSSWQQPLMACKNIGLVVLLMRQINKQPEFLVTIDNEFGVSGQKTILPSYLIYPGENNEDKTNFIIGGSVISEMIQSEEGGRFYQNESVFKVIEISNEITINNNQRWISLSELRSILKTSCFASYQLRCISSLILNLLNQNTFGN